MYKHAESLYRPMPWRENISPYFIFVSEVMLQQTQVDRVLSKFDPFIKKFPSFEKLADAPLANVYGLWRGLGYNRRAKWLRDAARQIVDHHNETLPDTVDQLSALPGIGKNTAAAILVYAYNLPLTYVETNIRTIFIHHFFKDELKVHDRMIIPLVEATLDRGNPRRWYWALMDYGTYLKKNLGNASRRSRSYVVQKSFIGSSRMIRGKILRFLSDSAGASFDEIVSSTGDDSRSEKLLSDLIHEGLVCEDKGIYRIGD